MFLTRYLYWRPVRRRRILVPVLVTLHKLGEIPLVRRWLTTSQCPERIRSQQSLALVMTVATSLFLHGMADPAGILLTFGGTAVNVRFVFGHLPSRDVLSLISARIRRSA